VNARRQHFVRAYLGEAKGNATKAALIAGYSQKAAKQIGSRLLTYADVQQAIQKHADRADASTERILQNVARIANRQPETKLTGTEVLKASELLLRVNGALNEKATQSRITVNIGFLTSNAPSVAVTTDDEQAAAIDAVVATSQAQLKASKE
jgi:phage terminase small subunit